VCAGRGFEETSGAEGVNHIGYFARWRRSRLAYHFGEGDGVEVGAEELALVTESIYKVKSYRGRM